MKKLLCLLLCMSLLLLTACSGRVVTDAQPAVTLPPAAAWDVPHGNAGMTIETTVPLCLPSADGQRLVTVYTTLPLDHTRQAARTVVEALLAYPADERVRDAGHGVALSLYGHNPVEISGGVCTVNLASSALELDHSDFYALCLSLAATLTWQDGITAVNVLVCDTPVGLDIAGYLPTGTVATHPGEDLASLWELMEARHVPLGQSAADVPLTSSVTLYFPLSDGSGIMPEARTITFAGQSPSQLASGLLSALGSGALLLDGTCTMPDLTSMLTQQPMISELADGSRMITLYFTPNLEDRLLLAGIEPMCFTAAVVCTLTTFIPGVSSVCIVSGSTMITSMYSRQLGELSFRDGIQRRTQYSDMLREQVTIYLARDSRLVPVTRTVSASTVNSPGQLLELLSQGPTSAEQAEGITAAIPDGFSSRDLLGMRLDGDILSVNLSERIELAITDQTMDESLICYSIATTLCASQNMKRIRFCFASEMVETLNGDLYWGGTFMLNASVL